MSGKDFVSTREKVAGLSSCAIYPDCRSEVEVIETHMSWVFIPGDVVYKLKKPVRYPFLDFTTLAAREADCREEVRLNERLAPEVYLGVVPLMQDVDGKLSLEGGGTVVDWLVKMRRLPADRMLDHAIAADAVSKADVENVAGVLANFYRQAPPADFSPADYLDRFSREQDVNRSVLTMTAFDLPCEPVNTALNTIEAFIAGRSDLLADRVRSGLVVEGHGDLRPEHICLLDPPVIIDCLEFNRSLRLVDPFDELAFLALECERLGAGWVGETIVERCGQRLGGRPLDELLAFYTVFRASLRARLAVGHLLEPQPRDPEKWLPLAQQYLTIAEGASLSLALPGDRRSIRPRGTV